MAKKKVTDEEFLNAIAEYHIDNGFNPSMREIGDAVGMSSTSSVKARFDCLIRQGKIFQYETQPRAYRVKAEWLIIPFDGVKCSVCGGVIDFQTMFCPSCGMKMENYEDD